MGVMREVVGGLVFLILLTALFIPLERRFAVRPRASPFFSRRRLTDLAHWLVTGPIGRVLANVAAVAAIATCLPAVLAVRSGKTHHIPLVVALIAVDLVGYWVHRIMHRSTFWPFHAIHHSPRELDWFTSARNHPLAEAIGRALGVIPLVLLGVDFAGLAPLVPIFGLWGIFLHANVRWKFGPLRYVITTPHFHRWHHARDVEAHDKNFAGLFPIWDIAFGTFHLPSHEPTALGTDDPIPETFFAQLTYPLRALALRWRPCARSSSSR